MTPNLYPTPGIRSQSSHWQEHLDELAARPPSDKAPVRIKGQHGAVSYDWEVHDADAIGVKLGKLRFQRAENRSAASPHERAKNKDHAPARVRAKLEGKSSRPRAKQRGTSPAERFCERVQYLGETLELLEQSTDDAPAVIRSAAPVRRDDGYHYYEANVSDDSVAVERFRANKGQPREATGMTLTRETLERLFEDVQATLQSE